ncbi:MAG: hypothetical protein LBP24_02390 [Coriobacteriales bacterium]|jgi:hypothetical protein|nr:hypothetical protein [Coriobacteriales bacterium]
MDLSRDDILALLDELVAELKAQGISGTIAIYGGSAVSFYHPTRGVTRDVDSFFQPYEAIADVAARIAARHPGLGDTWLNMQIYDKMPPEPDDDPTVYYADDALTIQFGSQEYLLAMKAMTGRRSEQDKADAALLFNELGLCSWLDIAEVVGRYYGSAKNAGSQELFWEDIADVAGRLL